MNSKELAQIMDPERMVNPNRTRKNSKKKGSNYESKLCKQLNERFKTKEFSKTPGSGAYATTHNLPEHLKIYGDVITPKNFRFVIDAKKGYNHLAMTDCLNPRSELYQMLEHLATDARKAHKQFILVVCQDRRDPVAIVHKDVIGISQTHVEKFHFKSYTGLLLSDLLSFEDSFFFE